MPQVVKGKGKGLSFQKAGTYMYFITCVCAWNVGSDVNQVWCCVHTQGKDSSVMSATV